MLDDAEDEFSLLAANDPFSDAWDEDGILGRLMEEALFDEDGYGDLEAEMIRAMADASGVSTLGVIVRIVERVTLMVKRHVDPADDYRIVNLDDEQVAELDRRVRFCLVEMSVGNAPDMSRWEN